MDSEFGDQAATIAAQLVDLAVNDQIAAACRGSGNPVALAWLAENLRLNDVSMVVDVGAGLGGPSVWMRARYGCRIVAIEPEEQAARAASSIFGLPTIVGAASHSSIASDTFDSALLLGVVSVVDDPDSVLSEAHRIAYTLGLIDYCSTGSDAVRAGGSTFRTERQLRELVAANVADPSIRCGQRGSPRHVDPCQRRRSRRSRPGRSGRPARDRAGPDRADHACGDAMTFPTQLRECPKSMTFGPCGGVRQDGACEVDARPCPFLGAHETAVAPRFIDPPRLLLPEPAIVVDVRAPASWRGDHEKLWRTTAETLGGCVALLGEHVDNPPLHDDSGALPPSHVITILRDAGVSVLVTITGRDRDLADATELINDYRDAGATAIHCVTGDHPAAVGIDRAANFGAEAMTLVAAAAQAGIPATVGESPASPGRRSERLGTKQTAGASLCVLNHAGDPENLIRFADECERTGVTLPLIAPVPMIADRHAALGLANFPGLRLPDGLLDAIIGAPDPAAAGLDAAGALIRAFTISQRFAGINLSGGAGGLDPWERLRLTGKFIELARHELLDADTTLRRKPMRRWLTE